MTILFKLYSCVCVCKGLDLLSINTLFCSPPLLCVYVSVCESNMNNAFQKLKNPLEECGQMQCVQCEYISRHSCFCPKGEKMSLLLERIKRH